MAALGCGLRFWQLARFDTLVFDEIYFVQFAQDYLSNLAPFDAHPPLGKYLIAAGIWLHRALSVPASVGYRWMNAIAGSAVPLIVMGLARTIAQQASQSAGQLVSKSLVSKSLVSKSLVSKSLVSESSVHESAQKPDGLRQSRLQTFGLLAGLFVAIDGLFVVESRYGLLNIYVVLLGLLGQWLWLLRDGESSIAKQRKCLLGMLSGLCLGGAIATKWNGLGFTLSLLLWTLWQRRQSFEQAMAALVPFFFYLGGVSGICYWAIWQPHLWMAGETFGSVHSRLLSFHQQLSPIGHSACSRWFTWPLLIKPIAYWYEEDNGLAYTVNNMGNPALWWLSSSTMLLILIDRIHETRRRSATKIKARCMALKARHGTSQDTSRDQDTSRYILTFCLISYSANWLPWLWISRCTFIYLYMPAAAFSFMGLAWLMSGWLHAQTHGVRVMGWCISIVIALAFLFWLPLSLGSPLSTEGLQLRWWLKSWI